MVEPLLLRYGSSLPGDKLPPSGYLCVRSNEPFLIDYNRTLGLGLRRRGLILHELITNGGAPNDERGVSM